MRRERSARGLGEAREARGGPIRGQYPGHVITLDQSEVSMSSLRTAHDSYKRLLQHPAVDGGSLASLMVSEGDGESDGVRGNGEQ